VVKVPDDTTQSYTRRVQPKPHFFTLWPTLFLCDIYGIEKKGSGYQRNILELRRWKMNPRGQAVSGGRCGSVAESHLQVQV
jgi:hypothetical protein